MLLGVNGDKRISQVRSWKSKFSGFSAPFSKYSRRRVSTEPRSGDRHPPWCSLIPKLGRVHREAGFHPPGTISWASMRQHQDVVRGWIDSAVSGVAWLRTLTAEVGSGGAKNYLETSWFDGSSGGHGSQSGWAKIKYFSSFQQDSRSLWFF